MQSGGRARASPGASPRWPSGRPRSAAPRRPPPACASQRSCAERVDRASAILVAAHLYLSNFSRCTPVFYAMRDARCASERERSERERSASASEKSRKNREKSQKMAKNRDNREKSRKIAKTREKSRNRERHTTARASLALATLALACASQKIQVRKHYFFRFFFSFL